MMPVYNTCKKYFEESIKSALLAIEKFNDIYGNESELLIGDDGSTNTETIDIFNKYANHPNIRIIHFVHEGLPKTLNKMIYDHTQNTEFICYFDSDDVMTFDRLLIQYNYMKNYLYSFTTMIGGNTTNVIPWYNGVTSIRNMYFEHKIINDVHDMYNNPICHPTIFYRRNDIVRNKIRYDENDQGTCDYDFYCRILQKNLQLLLIPESVIMYRITDNPNQITQTLKGEIWKNLTKIRERYNM
jgi:hypothetical protein